CSGAARRLRASRVTACGRTASTAVLMNRNTAVASAREAPAETSACLTNNGRDGGAILLVLAAAAVTGFLAIGALAAAFELHRQELTERSILQAELSAE